MLDTDGRVVSWNEGAQRMKGYTASEIIGKHFSCFYPEDDVRDGKPARELKIASETGRFEDEGLRVRKDGSHFQANVVINAIRDKSGKLRGFSKITRDITEQKRAEEVLRASVRLGEYTLNHSLDELLTYILDEAESLTGSRIGFFHFLEPDQRPCGSRPGPPIRLKICAPRKARARIIPSMRRGCGWKLLKSAGRPCITIIVPCPGERGCPRARAGYPGDGGAYFPGRRDHGGYRRWKQAGGLP